MATDSAKLIKTTFIDFDIYHQMETLQKSYSVTLPYIFKVKWRTVTKLFLQICLYSHGTHRRVALFGLEIKHSGSLIATLRKQNCGHPIDRQRCLRICRLDRLLRKQNRKQRQQSQVQRCKNIVDSTNGCRRQMAAVDK